MARLSPEESKAVRRCRRILDAQKVAYRKDGGTTSWKLLLELDTGKKVEAYFGVESIVGTGTRLQRYGDKCGTAGVVKSLKWVEPKEVEQMPLVLKSFHRSFLSGVDLADLRRAMHYMYAQGDDFAYAGLREPSKSSSRVSPVPFVIMQYIGNEAEGSGDLFSDYMEYEPGSDERKFAIRTKAQQKNFLGVFSRFLAQLAFFHKHEKRPFLDLKAENIRYKVGPSGELQQLLLIDYDGSVGNNIIFTPGYYNEDDCSRISRAMGRKDVSALKISDDYKALAITLALLVEGAVNCDFNLVEYPKSDAGGVMRGHYRIEIPGEKSKGSYSAIERLYTAFSEASDELTCEAVLIGALKGYDDAKECLAIFRETMAQCQSRFVESASTFALGDGEGESKEEECGRMSVEATLRDRFTARMGGGGAPETGGEVPLYDPELDDLGLYADLGW